MTTSTFTGEIKNFSPKPEEDYYGILIDNGQEEKWINGKGKIPGSWNKGDKVKVKVNQDQFVDIKEVHVIGGGQNKAGQHKNKQGSGQVKGSGSNNESLKGDGKAASDNIYVSPELQVALKEAVETVRCSKIDLNSEKQRAEHIQQVKNLVNGYYNILKDLSNEKNQEEG